jgi:hypothetical protein
VEILWLSSLVPSFRIALHRGCQTVAIFEDFALICRLLASLDRTKEKSRNSLELRDL